MLWRNSTKKLPLAIKRDPANVLDAALIYLYEVLTQIAKSTETDVFINMKGLIEEYHSKFMRISGFPVSEIPGTPIYSNACYESLTILKCMGLDALKTAEQTKLTLGQIQFLKSIEQLKLENINLSELIKNLSSIDTKLPLKVNHKFTTSEKKSDNKDDQNKNVETKSERRHSFARQ